MDVEICTVGKKATSFFKNSGLPIKSVLTDLGDAPHFDDLLGTVKVMLDAYDKGEIQQLSVAYNRFEIYHDPSTNNGATNPYGRFRG